MKTKQPARKTSSMDLTKDPIPSLIRKLAIPASIGFFFHTLYNLTDTFFAGKLDTESLAAMGIGLPIFMFIIALASGIGTGANALIANALGEKNLSQAKKLTVQGFVYGTILSVCISIVGFFLAPWLFEIQGASGVVLEKALEYMLPMIVGAILFVLVYLANSVLSSQGDTKTFSKALAVGALVNIALDPLFMFGFGPIPAFGLAGVAYATLIIELGTLVYMFYKVTQTDLWPKNHGLTVWKPDISIFRELTEQGFPASFNMMTVSIGWFIINYFLALFSTDAVAAYSVAVRIEQVILLPSIGLNIAMLVLTGQNNGARKYERIMQTYKKVLWYGFLIMIIGSLILFFFHDLLLRIFTDDVAVLSIGGRYLTFAAFMTFGYVLLFVTTSMLQGLKKPYFALWMGIIRQIVLPLCLFWLFGVYFGLKDLGVWFALLGIVWVSALYSLWYGLHVFKKKKAKHTA